MRVLWATVLIAVAVVGCGGLASANATPSAPTVTPAPAPSGWSYLPWYDPDLELAVPSGWISTTKFETWSPDPSLPADVAAGAKWWNDKVAAGAIRMQANAPSDGPDTASVLVTVESGDASLEAFVERATHEYTSGTEMARHAANSAVGPCVVVDYAVRLSTLSSLSRDYHCRLGDGRSLLVEVTDTAEVGASPAPDAASFTQLADQIVSTLRPHR